MKSTNHFRAARPGAVVIGGDYQGLGIVRSLGHHGVPVCVVDDESSIACYSRYTKFARRVPTLHDEKQTILALMELGREQGLRVWVLYPTRDETVAALSKHRPELSEFFRVPTPDWESVKWLWARPTTYSLRQKFAI